MSLARMSLARTLLVLDFPFFGALALRLKLIEDPSVESACTDGHELRFSPEYVKKFTDKQLVALVAHEVMHPALLHMTRKGTRDHHRFNIACDYTVDPILQDAGLDVPDPLVNPDWANKAAEEIYNLLPKNLGKHQNSCGKGEFKPPTGKDGKPLSAGEVTEVESEWKTAVVQAAHAARQMGKLPAGIDRMLGELLEPKVNWEEELRRFCLRPIPGDVNWNTPNRRYIHNKLYLPSTSPKYTGIFATVIDTSGSIGEKELTAFGSEIAGIVDQLQPEMTYVIYCDAAVNRVDIFKRGDELVFKGCGGGGTDFRPPFKWLEERSITPDALVYLTDGYGSFPNEDDVNYPVLWAVANSPVQPPFGTHITVEF